MDRAELIRQVRAGEYVVDPHAIAGAMLSHASTREMLMSRPRRDGGSGAVLEPRQVDRLAAGADEGDPASGPDAA